VNGARFGWLAGLWVGVVDGAIALHRMPELAGTGLDRVGALGLAMLCDAAIGALAGATLGRLLAWSIGSGRRSPRPLPSAGFSMALVASALAAAVAVAAQGWPRPVASSDDRPNIVLISIDTLRADHLGLYGYPRDTSPHLQEFARAAVTFERAYSNSPWTLPSHASIFTGLDPFAHGALSHESRLSEVHVTVAERLRDDGYTTGAFVGALPSDFIGARRGLDQGFGFYRHVPYPARLALGFVPYHLNLFYRQLFDRWLGRAGRQVDTALRWLAGGPSEPFFLFLHFWDVHSRFGRHPYEAPKPYFDRFCPGALDDYDGCRGDLCASYRLLEMVEGDEPLPRPDELEKIRCLYDGTVAYVDEQLARLFAGMDALGLGDRSVVVVTSDHGEGFIEHGSPLHFTLHDEVLKVPLVIRLPGGARGKRAQGNAELMDLAPTLLELAGVDADPLMQGESLVEVLRSWPAESDATVLAVDHMTHSTSLHRGRLKYIHNPEQRNVVRPTASELYDLSRDAGEQANEASGRPEVAEEMKAIIESRRRASEKLRREIIGREPARPVELDEEERERLRALGYGKGAAGVEPISR
jgi:arylsulfatase A-like enzyme